MAGKPGQRRAAILCAIAVLRGNRLTDADLELQLEAIWKSGYQAGRKALHQDGARVKAAKVAQGVAALKRIREQSLVSAITLSTNHPSEKDK